MLKKIILYSFLVLQFTVCAEFSLAQIDPPDNKVLFKDDQREVRRIRTDEKQSVLKRDSTPNDGGTYFNAPQLEFYQDKDEFVGQGGVVVAYGGTEIQADSGRFNTKTKEAALTGQLILSTPEGQISSQSGKINLESETGVFNDAKASLEVDGYQFEGGKVEKKSELEYLIEDASMTTCDCIDGSKPWSLESDSIEITAGGYGKAKPFFLKCNDFPVFYSPYFVFPARLDRHSGLLIPQLGFSGKHGFQYLQPIFWNIDDSTDVIVTPFTETRTRTGMQFELAKKFSLRSSIETKLIYSDESARDGDLRGTQVSGLFDPEFDENRFGGYYKQRWRSKPGDTPLSVVIDGRYVSDDLFVREIEEDKIGLAQDRFITSRAYVSAPLGDYFNAQLSTEYSQSFVSDTDLVFQRLPELSLDGYRSLRIFGANPYGLKLVSTGSATATMFNRREGYDGNRYDLNPRFKIPFYYKNFFNGDLNFSAKQTYYSLRDQTDPEGGPDLDSSSDRGIYDFGASVSTVLERVYDVAEDGWLARLASVGALNQYDKLQRIKHTIEPFIQYGYTPEKDQDDLPLFDSTDRIRDRSIITYGMMTRAIGRFADAAKKRGVIEEIAPDEIQPDDSDPYSSAFDPAMFDDSMAIRRIRGEKKELAAFAVKQSYDKNLEDTETRPWSDVAAGLSLYPNSYFGINFGSDFDYEDKEFSSWSMSAKLEDDRGDNIRTRVSYIEDSVSQLDGNLELVLTDRLRIGYYGKYDDREGELIENRVALRILSSCDCWKIDLGYRDRLNPDDQTYTLLLTLKGLGDIGQ